MAKFKNPFDIGDFAFMLAVIAYIPFYEKYKLLVSSPILLPLILILAGTLLFGRVKYISIVAVSVLIVELIASMLSSTVYLFFVKCDCILKLNKDSFSLGPPIILLFTVIFPLSLDPFMEKFLGERSKTYSSSIRILCVFFVILLNYIVSE